MKTLILDNRELNYEICTSEGEYSYSYYTRFYEGTYTIQRKKFYLFGDVITITKPKFIFDLWFNVESENLSQEDYDKKKKRFEEIKNGKIV